MDIIERDQVETIAQAIALFETVGMPARNLSARTREEYLRDLEDLRRFLEGREVSRIAAVSLRDLERYQAEMDRRGYTPATRRRKTYTIRSFFTFLEGYGVVSDNVAERLVPPRVPPREPRFLSRAEYQRLQLACRHHPRDAAIIEVFLQTGMRLSELARLSLDDVELPRRITRDPEGVGTVHVLRKGGADATVPLNHKACKALKNWLQVRPEVDSQTLFVTKFKKPMGTQAIQDVVAKHLRGAGITDASTHTLRHTTFTHHLAAGTDLRTVQEMAGHADLKTTAIYVHLAKKVMRKAVQEHAL